MPPRAPPNRGKERRLGRRSFLSAIELAGGIVLAAAFALPLAAAAQAQDDTAKQQAERQITQPGNNAPVWRDVRSGDPAYTSIKGQEVNVLIQPTMKLPGQPALTGGEAWRLFRNGVITPIGGWLLAAVVVVIGAALRVEGSRKGAREAHRPAHRAVHGRAALRALGDGDQLRDPRHHRAS